MGNISTFPGHTVLIFTAIQICYYSTYASISNPVPPGALLEPVRLQTLNTQLSIILTSQKYFGYFYYYFTI